MPTLNYHQLQYFWAVAREGGIAPASKVLHRTPSAISTQVTTLQRGLGVRLFAKRGRKLVLTQVGHAVYRYADEIFSAGAALMDVVDPGAPRASTTFVVGVEQSAPKIAIHHVLAPLLRLKPAARLTILEKAAEELIEDLLAGKIDIMLASAPAPPHLVPRIASDLLGETNLRMFGIGALATRYRKNFPHSLNGAPVLLPTEGQPLRAILDGWFIRNKIVPNIIAEVSDSTVLRGLGQLGAGLFAAAGIVSAEIRHKYHVAALGTLDGVTERFYAIARDDKRHHPASVLLAKLAKDRLGHAQIQTAPIRVA